MGAQNCDVRYGSGTDISRSGNYVRFALNNGHRRLHVSCREQTDVHSIGYRIIRATQKNRHAARGEVGEIARHRLTGRRIKRPLHVRLGGE